MHYAHNLFPPIFHTQAFLLPAAEASRSRCDAFLPFCVFDAFFEMEAEGTYPSSRLKIEGLVKSSTGPPTSACTLNLLNIGGRGTEVEGTEAEGT